MLQNIKLYQILDTSTLVLEEELSITEALLQLTESGVGTILVNSAEQWFSISSKTLKLLTKQGKGYLKLKDILVIIPPLKTTDTVNIWELLRLMRSYRVDCLTVVNQKREPIGVIVLEKVLKFLEKVARPQIAGGWYEYITDTTAEGIFIVDLDLTLLFVNTKLSSLLGYATGMMEGRNLNEFLVFSEQNDQQVETERHFRFQSQDGTDVWAMVVATPLFDENGHNIGTLGRISNITEKVTKQRKEKRKLAALEIATDGIAILNSRGEFIYTNNSFCKLLQKTNQNLIETDWWSIYGNYRRTPVEVELKQSGRWQGEFLYEGRYLDVSLSMGDEDIICICRDVTDRYQAQQALRESEERYRLLAEYSTDVIARCTVQGRYSYVSPACKEIWGYDPEEMLHHVFFDYIHPEDCVKVRLAYEVMLAKLDSNRFIYRFCHKDGSYIWMETTARVKRYSDTNAPMEIVTVSREVTENIEAESELVRSQERLKLILEATNDGLWDWDIISGTLYCSDRLLSMLGYETEEVSNRFESWLELAHPEDKDRVVEELNYYLSNKIDHYESEFRIQTKDKTYKWVFVRGKLVESSPEGIPKRMLGALSDISRRKEIEEELKRQYQRVLLLEQITNQIRSSFDIDAILAPTVQELSNQFNQSCILVTFCCKQELVYSSDDRLRQIELDLLPSSVWELDQVTLINPEVVNLNCASDLALVRTSYQNHCNGLMLLCSFEESFLWQKEDIELLEAVAEQLGIAIAQAELLRESQVQSELAKAANRAKSDFLAMMSHEIRTPMNGVIGMTELLLCSELNEQQKELAQTILQSSKTLLTILNDILDFSKIESGQMTLDCQPFELSTAIEEVLGLMTSLCYEKQLELVYDFDLNLPATVVGDVTRFRQIVINLLSNAIKFSHEGQILVQVSLWRGESLLLMVEDTGIGIDPTRINDLFLPFTQLDPSITRNYGGTGLGLAISKFLVELMGGYIWVESNQQIGGAPPEGWLYHRLGSLGSSFYVALPLTFGETTPNPPPINKHILVVEPNDSLRAVLQKWMTAWGLTVEMQAEIATARSVLKQKKFDLIFIDSLFSPGEIMSCVAEVEVPVVVLQQPGDDAFPCVTTLTKPLKPYACRQVLESLLLSQSSPSPVPAEEPPPLPPLRVLLVEDNPVNQKVAQRLLQKLGYSPALANNGVEALELLQSQCYDVVLMDVQMPEMDGLTATQKIRQEQEHQPYIIAMTANAMRGDREICLGAGMNDYLSKPISIESLGQALRRASFLHKV